MELDLRSFCLQKHVRKKKNTAAILQALGLAERFSQQCRNLVGDQWNDVYRETGSLPAGPLLLKWPLQSPELNIMEASGVKKKKSYFKSCINRGRLLGFCNLTDATGNSLLLYRYIARINVMLLQTNTKLYVF